MRPTLLITFLITVLCATSAYSQKTALPVEKSKAATQAIIRLMTDWNNFSNRHDTDGLTKLLPADLILTFQDGEVQTRDEYIAALKANPADFTVKDYDQKVVFFENNVAVIRAGYEVNVGGQVSEFRYTTTFIRRQGRWQPIAFHSSPLIKK